METEDPYHITLELNHWTLVSDWSRVVYSEVDYGWVAPVHAVLLVDLYYIAMCILVCPSVHKTDACLITQCVAAKGIDVFHMDMMHVD
jgi:hypothetical protein